MAGHSRPKDGVAFARLCPGHPRLSRCLAVKTWMPATSAGMTERGARRQIRQVITGLVPVISLRKARPCPMNWDGRDKPGHDDFGAAPHPASLTLILYDIIPNSVRSARGRSHEASCGWDRMRRPRPGEDVSPAPGRRRELRPAAIMSRPPGAWLSGADRPPCASPKNAKPGREQRTVPAKRGPAQ